MQEEYLLIGIDGGATKVNAREVVYDKTSSTFSLGKAYSRKSYRDVAGYLPNYKPVDLNTQLNERNAKITPTLDEQQQAAVYVEACSLVIEKIVEQTGISSVLIGLGMPGLKTDDKRGIAVVANGPRMINYSEQLEKRIELAKIKLISPIDHLGSDADYCGIGENYSHEGLFRNSENAYFLGGGTGVADAMKIDGKLLTFDNAKEWIAKTWEMKSAEGLSLERVTSVSGIQNTYAEYSGTSVEDLNLNNIYPLQISDLAKQGNDAAQKTYQLVNSNLAQLLYERIVTLNQGWQNSFEFVNPNKPQLNQNHPYLHKVFNKIIIGQRLGELFNYKSGIEIVKEPILKLLHEKIQNSNILSELVKAFYNNLHEIVKTSNLIEAPALGAGIDAYFTLKNDEMLK